jgi:hypothetical protein
MVSSGLWGWFNRTPPAVDYITSTELIKPKSSPAFRHASHWVTKRRMPFLKNPEDCCWKSRQQLVSTNRPSGIDVVECLLQWQKDVGVTGAETRTACQMLQLLPMHVLHLGPDSRGCQTLAKLSAQVSCRWFWHTSPRPASGGKSPLAASPLRPILMPGRTWGVMRLVSRPEVPKLWGAHPWGDVGPLGRREILWGIYLFWTKYGHKVYIDRHFAWLKYFTYCLVPVLAPNYYKQHILSPDKATQKRYSLRKLYVKSLYFNLFGRRGCEVHDTF